MRTVVKRSRHSAAAHIVMASIERPSVSRLRRTRDVRRASAVVPCSRHAATASTGSDVRPTATPSRSRSLFTRWSGTTAAGPNWALDDRQFKAEWLDDKAHPITGEPLQITEIELPPGSMVSCLTHAPHAVSPKKVTATGSGTTRYCTLFCYAAADPEGKQRPSDARATWSLPIEFERKAVGGQLKSVDPDVARGLFMW